MRTLTAAPLLLLALVGCDSGGGTATTASAPSSGGGNATQRSALHAMNVFRAQAKVSDASISDVLDASATRHAGYQAIRGGGLTHYESTDGTPNGPPDSANALFTAVGLSPRIRAQNHGADLISSGFYYEDIASDTGDPAIADLWNTVYHRLPMMRHETSLFGYGDQGIARATYPTKGVPAGNGFATCDFAAPSGARTLSVWPADGATGIGTTFDTDTESPDPVDAGNPYQSPHTPTQSVVGTPIHLIAPVTTSWTSVTASVTVGSTSLPLFVLCGFGPIGHDINTASVTAAPAGTVNDSFLQPGEIFLLPQNALTHGTLYTVSITAQSLGGDTVTTSWSFTTAP